jgi:hypothetical protein
LERPGVLFAEEKRERKEAERGGGAKVFGSCHRKRHEWLYSRAGQVNFEIVEALKRYVKALND